MGEVAHNNVTDALGVGDLLRRPLRVRDRAQRRLAHEGRLGSGDLARRGYAIVAWWDSDATIHSNTLVENPRGLGAFASARFIRKP